MNKLARFLPFLGWFPLRGDTAKADFLAGITVALVLIPQSMAYAQLAGLPPYFGLYAAFLPVAIASLFGSSAFLSTGPVAVVSLLTASALTPLAAPGSPQFIALAILLALLVGVTQLLLGLFKLGVVVNFLSHPVIVGFTNAAALIIGLSQISKLFGVPMGRSESFMHDIAGVFAQIGDTHWPTLAMGLLALGLMWGIKKYKRKWPGVLIAVALTTTLSWAIGFEKNLEGRADQIADPALTGLVADLGKAQQEESRLAETKASLMVALKEARRDALRAGEAARLGYELDLATIATTEAEGLTASLKKELRQVPVARVIDAQGATLGLYRLDQVPAGARTDGAHYSIRGVKGEGFKLVGGGEVVGRIPEGLPALALPSLSLDAIGSLLTAAIVISLVGFMEAISIAKALATKAKQKVDPNQELIGQGLANILGGFSQAFPASGSFSRSAVNFDAGARSGLSSVFTALFVLITLLFLTPLLYHLPQAVLAAIIIMAVIGLVNIEAVKHAWEASRHDGIAAIVDLRRHPGLRPPSGRGHPGRRRPGHPPLPLPHHEAARRHSGPLQGRHPARHQGPPRPADQSAHQRHPLRWLPLFRQCRLFRGRVLEAVATKPRGQMAAGGGRWHQPTRCLGRGGGSPPGGTVARSRHSARLFRSQEADPRRHAPHRPLRPHWRGQYLRHRRQGHCRYSRAAGGGCGG